jgi:hypothetical protein
MQAGEGEGVAAAAAHLGVVDDEEGAVEKQPETRRTIAGGRR